MADRRIYQSHPEDQVVAESSPPRHRRLGKKPSNQMEKGPFNGNDISRITIKIIPSGIFHEMGCEDLQNTEREAPSEVTDMKDIEIAISDDFGKY